MLASVLVRRRLSAGWGALAGAFICALSPLAAAQEQPALATPCEEGGLTCMTVPLSFERSESLPIEFDFDTGWVPQGSSLQVRLQALLAATTRVALQGDLVADWPHAEEGAAVRLRTPGRQDGGMLDYHYGLVVSAEGKVQISIWPFNYTWQGPLPYVPQVDFQVMEDEVFDAWGFEGIYSSASTEQVNLAQVDVSSLIGVSIPGVTAGFALDAAVELEVRYTHDELDIQHLIEGQLGDQVAGGAIISEDGESWAKLGLLPYEDYLVSARGTVDYDGVLHLIPAFFVKLLGQTWSIPVADIPIPFQITEADWSFDPQRVRVPLPYLKTAITELDFGEIEVGSEAFRTMSLENIGLHTLAADLALADTQNFALYDQALQLEPEDKLQPVVRFIPTQAGDFETSLMVTSNDPAEPLRMVTLRGRAFEPELPPPPPEPVVVLTDSNCGCRTVNNRGEQTGGYAALALLGLAALRRRRR